MLMLSLLLLLALGKPCSGFLPGTSLGLVSTGIPPARGPLTKHIAGASGPRARALAPAATAGGTADAEASAFCSPVPSLHQPAADRFHVHFGAGRLGIGLVVGSLEDSGDSFAIVQRPNDDWSGLPRGSIVDVCVNGKTIAPDVAVVNTQFDVERLWRQSGGERVRALATTGDEAVLQALCEHATSFSCSLGPGMRQAVLPLLSRLPERPAGERPVLYACENDHVGARAMGARLAKQVEVCCCMVDRICTGRSVGGGRIDVSAEEGFGGSMVLLDPVGEGVRVPFGGATVVVPRSAREAQFLYDRKVSLVNGMHLHHLYVGCTPGPPLSPNGGSQTVLAFMTLRQNGPGDHTLVTYSTADAAQRAQIWAWAAVRCLMLLQEYGMETVKAAQGVSTDEEALDALLAFAWQTLGRFSAVEDTTGRILGGGVSNRWAGRLWPVMTFVRWNRGLSGLSRDTNSAGARLMRRAGVSPVFAAQCCNDLVTEGLQFCAAEMHDLATRLVAYYKSGGSAPPAPATPAGTETDAAAAVSEPAAA